jgi:choline dehydrogenase-like flavoprotein
MADIEADVIIVGSGIAGALLAARLAEAGVKVAILEAGARVDRAEATQRFWDAAIKVPECPDLGRARRRDHHAVRAAGRTRAARHRGTPRRLHSARCVSGFCGH